VTLPGADELFRSTGPGLSAVPAAAPEPVATADPALDRSDQGAGPGDQTVAGRAGRDAEQRAPSSRQRHDEKITVYISAKELLDLERARLLLRAEHGLAVDRGRIVREALAVVLADLSAKEADSILVRRLRNG